MAQTSDALVATRPAMKDLDWHNIWRAVRWPVYITLAILLIWYGPYFIAGYGWGYIGTGHASWSMAEDEGIMPGSLTIHRALSSYQEGDDVCFIYKGSDDDSENGKSVKRITAINPDSSYRVEGLNPLNTIPPCNVPPGDIVGKIVWHHSFLPTRYWRWLSMGWSLEQEEIAERYQMVFSIQTVVGVFTKKQFRNGVILQKSPSEYHLDNGLVYLITPDDQVEVYTSQGEFRGLDSPADYPPHKVIELVFGGEKVKAYRAETSNSAKEYVALIGDTTRWVHIGSRVIFVRESGKASAVVKEMKVISNKIAVPYGETRIYLQPSIETHIGPDDLVCVVATIPSRPL